jgi:riboflavin synthase
LRGGNRLGGHMMSGHVDGVGTVTRFDPAPGDAGSMLLVVEVPANPGRYIARKGSIAVNGVSLTLNTVIGRRCCVNLIPHTLAVTTLKHLAAGARVNLDFDLLARSAARLLDAGTKEGKPWT